MKNRKVQASIVLILMVIGFISTYNFNIWWGKIINAGFLAGTIGGLADWFAITALFRKPLGFISYGTEILPKNRERIIDEIVKFIGQDLLNSDYLIKQLNKISLSEVIKNYSKSSRVQKDLNLLSYEILSIIKDKLPAILPIMLELGNGRDIEAKQAKEYSLVIYKIIKSRSNDTLLIKVWIFIINIVEYLLKKEFIQQFLDYHIEAIKEKYVGNHFARSIAVGFIDLSGKDLVKKLVKYLSLIKEQLQADNSRLARYLQVKLARQIRKYLANPQTWEKIYIFIKNIIDKEEINKLTDKFEIQAEIRKNIEILINKNLSDDKQINLLSYWIKGKIIQYMESHRELQLAYLRGQLERYSNEELINLVESKVGDDLQIIRINGSIVGAIAGMVLFALSLGVERLWG